MERGKESSEKRSSLSMLKECEYLVFSGGGVKGICFVSALTILVDLFVNQFNLTEAHFFKQIKGTGGTSIGSILALAVCCEMDIKSLRLLTLDPDTWNFEHIRKNMDPVRFYKNRGFCDHQILYRNIDRVFDIVGLSKKITFMELHQRTRRLFVCNAACVEDRSILYMSFKTTPDMFVRDALCMSMCLPGFVVPFSYQGKEYVDGGFFLNYIADCFVPGKTIGFRTDNKPHPSHPRLPKQGKDTSVISIIKDQSLDEKNGIQYMCSLISTACSQIDEMYFQGLDERHKLNTITVYTPGFNSLKVTVAPEEINLLWQYGRWSVLWYFFGIDFISQVLEIKILQYVDEFTKQASSTHEGDNVDLTTTQPVQDLMSFN